jgi:P4 family phage/plasmid primase-like protien
MADLISQIKQAAQVLFRPGDVVEVRIPKTRFGVISGYFIDHERMAREIARLDGQKFPGVYWTLNPVAPDAIARADHKTLQIRSGEGTKDTEIVSRRWLPIDIDPQRIAGISSTEAQHEASFLLADQVHTALLEMGWGEAIRADSGNGAHLLYRIDLPNDAESASLIKRVLEGLHARFGTPEIAIDRTLFNASRICKAYGTWVRKGDNTADRPHRVSRLLYARDDMQIVPADLLRGIAAFAPEEPRRGPAPSHSRFATPPPFDLAGFLSKHGVRHRGAVKYDGGYKYVLDECPFDSSHKAPDAAVFEGASGKLGFKCLHNSCHGRDWREFREHFEGPKQPYQPRPHATPPVSTAAVAPALAPEPPEPDAEDKKIAQALLEAEEAADVAIESRSSAEVMRLAASVAKLRPMHQAVIVAKLRDGFREDWKALEKWFEKALKDAAAPAVPAAPADETGQNLAPVPPAGGEGEGAAAPPNLIGFPLTDSGNAERIVALFGHEIRYCTEMKSWFLWDGKRWAVDRSNVMRHKAMEMARLLYYQASQLAEGQRRTALDKHARAAESSKGITNALNEAERLPGVPVSAQMLDQHSDLLNFKNGTVCLRDGSLRPHDRAQLITKLCEYNYRPNAKAPLFQVFVEWAMGGPVDGNPDAELSEMTVRLVSFIQRVIGYSMTGDVSEKAVFVFYGADGDNGKTTLLTLFRELLGSDYASLLLIDTIMHARSTDNTAREDMADLRGARFVQTSEVSKEDRLNEQRVKFLTQGMGTIKSRRLHEHLVEFTATHKLLMDCNYRPNVKGQDNAIWRRLIQIPFLSTISAERRDLGLREKLKAEAEGILAWAVRGAIEWYKSGLGKPPEVMEAQQDWREHDDPLREFLNDSCNVDEDLFVPVKDLMSAYLLWCKEYGEKFPLARRSFNEALVGKGIKQERKALANVTTRIWVGLELKMEVSQKLRRLSGGFSEIE